MGSCLSHFQRGHHPAASMAPVSLSSLFNGTWTSLYSASSTLVFLSMISGAQSMMLLSGCVAPTLAVDDAETALALSVNEKETRSHSTLMVDRWDRP